MRTVEQLARADGLNVIGLMSGTSADGVDAALIRVTGRGESCRARLLASAFCPYSDALRNRLLALAGGESAGTLDFCMVNALLGVKFADACEAVCAKAGLAPGEVDLVGSHGHTFWHAPRPTEYLGERVAATLQLGDPSAVCERLGCAAVSDFRVRDVAAGGQGAPLVPYADWLLYRDDARNVALQNVGGIANVTFLPKGCALRQVSGFDTGPGNMLMDALAARIDPGLRYDPDGALAARGRVDEGLLSELMSDPYYAERPPKTTGREKFGAAYLRALEESANRRGLAPEDTLATATMLTARTIALACERFSPFGVPDRLVLGGGGAKNATLVRFLRASLPGAQVLTNEELGWDGDAKEAVAFAILAAECVHASPNNAPGATGAAHPVVMGKITQ